MIEGLKIKKLKVIPDERGRLMEILRNDDDCYTKFGQVYMTTTLPGVVKGYHWHQKQTDQVCCIHGMIKLVLYDVRTFPTQYELQEIFLGIHNPMLVTIPPYVLHGWKCVSLEEALVINCPSEPYNYKEPDENRVDPHNETKQIEQIGHAIPYSWDQKDF